MSPRGGAATVKTVRVALGPRSYDVKIGPGAISQLSNFPAPTKRAFIIADQSLRAARARLKSTLLKAGWEVHEFAVQAGEGLKDFKDIYPLYGKLLAAKAHRDSVLFALGGGSVGDAAGFLAATYLRGIAWVGVPTTLLAQVDSSLGGKTAVNHEQGKNLIGSFHQPSLVICDTDFLKTISPREWISGLGEIVKYGIAFDPAFFKFLLANTPAFLTHDVSVVAHCILRSVQWKAKMVARDEFDRKGAREVLNLGHTFGHVLESMTSYRVYQHGEAVLWGIRFALALSRVRGLLSASELEPIDRFLGKLPVPAIPKNFRPETLLKMMSHDKKVRVGKIHFVLVQHLGKTVSDAGVTGDDLAAAFRLLMRADGGGK